MTPADPHALASSDILKSLDSDALAGLSREETARRLAAH